MANNALIDKMLVQVAVYWSPAGEDRHGQQTFNDPVEIPCRWDWMTEEFLDRQGNTVLSNAKVYVGQDVEELGVLWLSTALRTDDAGTALAQLVSETDPFANSVSSNQRALEIRKFQRFPNRRATKFLRTVYL